VISRSACSKYISRSTCVCEPLSGQPKLLYKNSPRKGRRDRLTHVNCQSQLQWLLRWSFLFQVQCVWDTQGVPCRTCYHTPLCVQRYNGRDKFVERRLPQTSDHNSFIIFHRCRCSQRLRRHRFLRSHTPSVGFFKHYSQKNARLRSLCSGCIAWLCSPVLRCVVLSIVRHRCRLLPYMLLL